MCHNRLETVKTIETTNKHKGLFPLWSCDTCDMTIPWKKTKKHAHATPINLTSTNQCGLRDVNLRHCANYAFIHINTIYIYFKEEYSIV